MNIKKFIAETSQDALRMVRREMGPDAVILETRTITASGGHSGNGKERIEVTAAIDYDAPARPRYDGKELSQEVFLKKWHDLESNMRQIVDHLLMLEALNMAKGETRYVGLEKDDYIYYRHFGLNPSVVRLLGASTDGVRTNGKGRSRNKVKECLLKVINKINLGGASEQEAKSRIFSFIGPTGVGKTTTLAKLAAIHAIDKKKKVALITVDTFRIGAVAQLETYARIMGLPFEVATNRGELIEAIRRHSTCDVLLIDTAGRSPKRADDVREIVRIFQIPARIHHFLLLSATTQLNNLFIAQQSFGGVPIMSYIFTKIDEADDASAMINFLVMTGKPVSYFTTGQSVPEDIEPANKRRLAELILKRNRIELSESFHEVNQYGPS